MKTIMLLILISLSLNTFAQMPLDPLSKRFIYDGVVIVDSIRSEAIFNNAKEWIVRNLKSSDNIVNLNDKDSKSITATGNIQLNNRHGWFAYTDINLNFKFSVFVKDGRYRYIVENFYCTYMKITEPSAPNSSRSGAFDELSIRKGLKRKIYEEANSKILLLINDLEKNIKIPLSKKNDW